MKKDYLTLTWPMPNPCVVFLLASRSRRWPPRRPAPPRSSLPAWPPLRAGTRGDNLPEHWPIHSSAPFPPLSSRFLPPLLPPLTGARARAARAPSRRISLPSAPFAPPRRAGHPCRSRRSPEPCNAHGTVVFKLRPPASSDRFDAYSASPSKLAPPLHSP